MMDGVMLVLISLFSYPKPENFTVSQLINVEFKFSEDVPTAVGYARGLTKKRVLVIVIHNGTLLKFDLRPFFKC